MISSRLSSTFTNTATPTSRINQCPCTNGPIKTGSECASHGSFCVAGCSDGWTRPPNEEGADCTVSTRICPPLPGLDGVMWQSVDQGGQRMRLRREDAVRVGAIVEGICRDP